MADSTLTEADLDELDRLGVQMLATEKFSTVDFIRVIDRLPALVSQSRLLAAALMRVRELEGSSILDGFAKPVTEPRCRGSFAQRCVETAGHDGKCRPPDVYWRQALEAIEWSAVGHNFEGQLSDACPLCQSIAPQEHTRSTVVGHKPDCLIGLALG